MNWIICFFLSVVIFVYGIISPYLRRIWNKKNSLLVSVNIMVMYTFIAAVIIFIPIYNEIFSADNLRFIKIFLLSVHNAIRLFIVDGEFTIILDYLPQTGNWIVTAYSVFAAILFVAAPILTFGVVLSFFKNLSAYRRYLFSYFSDVYVFSELNERSLLLAESLKENNADRFIIFTDVFESNEENSYEMLNRVKKIGAAYFKKDIQNLNLKFHSKKSELTFFIIGETESENLDQAINLISDYKDRDNTNLYVFSSSEDSELLLMLQDKGKIKKVRRINDIRSLINRTLYDEGFQIFETASDAPNGEKQISAVIVGLGKYGSTMLKALSWFCQMDGYKVRIDAFDGDDLAAEKFEAQCPELMSPKFNGTDIPGEAHYEINIHSGISVDTIGFANEIEKLNNATYVFVALGNDEINVRIATYLRMLFERKGIHPMIQAIVNNSDEKQALSGITNYKKQPYDIEFIGDLKSAYTENVIIDPELEMAALDRHLRWGNEDEFWKFEYNYRSSIASAIHKEMKKLCKIPGIDKEAKDRNNSELWAIRRLEHRRWNAYMRSEGYCYAPQRNDLAKTHHCLVPFDDLSEKDQMKDDD